MPKVSVVVSVYNAEPYLRRCLDSIVGQTLREIEIICVDDGSTDGSPQILAEYARKDGRVRVVTQANAGAGAARNHGLRYAAGEYLSILDADDFFEPDMLRTAYDLAVQNDADMAVFRCDFYRTGTDTFAPNTYSIHSDLLPERQPFCAGDVEKDVFKLFVGWAWDKLIRRSLVERYGLQFQEQRTTNDMLFVFSALLLAKRIVTTRQVLAHHRQAEGTLSVTREKSWMCFYNALTALRGNMVQWGIFERFRQDYVNYCVHFCLWNLNTLQESTRTLLHNKLREEWFADLGVLDHPESYFYHKGEYKQAMEVVRYTPEQLAQVRRRREQARQTQNPLRRGLLCLQENGLGYTLGRIGKKMFRTEKK